MQFKCFGRAVKTVGSHPFFSTQKYFLVLWLWWLGLAVLSVIGLIYRLARIMVPDLSR
jgi:hypothetical protein